MFKSKKIISLILATAIISSMSTAAFATQSPTINIGGQILTMEEIAYKSNLDVNKLAQYYSESPDEFLAQVNELYSEKIQPFSVGDTSGESAESLSDLVSLGKKGDILISATNRSLIVYRHGHAAIVYDNENIIQAIGPNIKSKKSTLAGFGESEQVRLYEVSTATDDNATAASDYAAESLVNKDYDIDADANSKTKLNCATLIWQAYNKQGISLKKYFYTVRPQSLVEDTKTDAVGNIGWSGDQDSFDL